MDRYPPIGDHGLIGDLQTAALVSADGSVDWLCLPRFDSPSVFGALLDADDGGRCRIAPRGDGYTTRQMYFPDTAVLITRFMAECGVAEVIDLMPPVDTAVPTGRHRLVRMVRCVRGEVDLDVEVAPRFDYGRRRHKTEVEATGVRFSSETGDRLTVHPVRAPGDERLARWWTSPDERDLHATLSLRAGQVRGIVLESQADGPPCEVHPDEIVALFDETVRSWRRWLGRCAYRGRWRETVLRSAITLKLMTYAPTGAIVAAPTAGLPEQVGGERNWDYRFTWIRDASFSVYALLGLGFPDEAAAFTRWLRDRVDRKSVV